MTVMALSPRVRVEGPPGFPVQKYLDRLWHAARTVNTPEGRAFRYEMCRGDPVAFALYYLREHLELKQEDGTIVRALSELHVDFARSARRWAAPRLEPKAVRDVWVAPRYAAKSTWLFLILALWAMAYGYLKFIVVYGDTEDMVSMHFKTLRMELANNDRLRRDFPELCEPMRASGRNVMDNAGGYLAVSGARIMIKGMNSATLGVKLGQHRPDALFFDDIEPKKGSYSLDKKKKRLEDLIDVILPCNPEAVVQVAGTTVMHGSIIHDMVEGKDWVRAERFQVHHYKGILTDPATGEERSMWPQKWPLEFLHEERAENPRGFAKNYENRPRGEEGTFWVPAHISRPSPALLAGLSDRIGVVDPAAKSSKKNDETGIAMLSYSGEHERIVVEDVVGVRLDPATLRVRVHTSVLRHRIRLLLVDVTNGGDHVLHTLQNLPNGAKILPVQLRRSKVDRFTDLHDLYLRRVVLHARQIWALEEQMFSYPNVGTDDLIDAVCLGVEYFMERYKLW